MAGVTDRDAEAQYAHLAEGNARQARKRVGADMLLRDSAGRVLLVDPTYKPDWDLPGGMCEANEPPRVAVARELAEELGLTLTPGRLLAVEWESPHGPWDDQLAFVFDGGVLDDERAGALRITDPELGRFAFVPLAEAEPLLRPYVWQRLSRAHAALDGGADYFERDAMG
jgi:8-oxo-dGTP diphosphatase